MKKGFAYCGLACDFCTEDQDCSGCRNDGCTGKEWCQCFQCAHEKIIKAVGSVCNFLVIIIC